MNMCSKTSLPLFQYACNNDISPSLKKGIVLINTLIDLKYIEMNGTELLLTNSGIKYMMKNHSKFLKNIREKEIDFGIFTDKINLLKNFNPKFPTLWDKNQLSSEENKQNFN